MLKINYKFVNLILFAISVRAMEQQPEKMEIEESKNIYYENLFSKFNELPKNMREEVVKAAVENAKSMKDIRNLEKTNKGVREILYSKPISNLIARKRKEFINDIQKELNKINIPIDITKNINQANNNGYTALMAAATHDNKNLVNKLIDVGADINWQATHGTALISATFMCYLEIMEILISNKSNLNLTNSFDESALTVATQRVMYNKNKPKIRECSKKATIILLNAGAKVDKKVLKQLNLILNYIIC